MRRIPRSIFGVLATLAACGDDGASTDADAAGDVDAAVDPDASSVVDAAPDAPGVPLAGFGGITGMCGVLSPTELDGMMPRWFDGELDFGTNRYDDPAERSELTPGGREIILDGNAGGSSLYSEVFAFEWLARCELATLLKTETEIVYDTQGKKADLLVSIDDRKVGVSVTRAVMFPFGTEYTLQAATTLLDGKLDDIQIASTLVSAADAWTTDMLVVLAYDLQHAQVAMQAWSALDAATRGEVIVVVVVTSGDDTFVYTDS